MTISIQRFVENLTSCGLMTAEDVAALQQELSKQQAPASGDALASSLVEAGRLTAYQAETICREDPGKLVLGNYELLEKIGQGGMGEVFRARHRRMNRQVALKILPPAMTYSPAAVERFQREVHAAARLEHLNVVTSYDADEADGIHFLVMQYVDGIDLSARVKRNGPLPIDQAVDFVQQAARGLAYAHNEGVIHRDIKPGNILLDKHGQIKILDLGLAKFEEPTAALTDSRHVVGTLAYMSPEQIENTRDADRRSDIYSLGCTLFYLLTGHPPYQDDSPTRLILAHTRDPIPSARESRSEIPQALDDILAKMLAKDATQRLQSMDDVIGELSMLTVVASPLSDNAQIAETITLPAAEIKSDVQNATDKQDASRDATVDLAVETTVDRIQRKPAAKRKWTQPAFLVAIGVLIGILAVVATMVLRGPGNKSNLPLTNNNSNVSSGHSMPLTGPADQLRRNAIPYNELKAAGIMVGGQPPEPLVAILGESRLKHWAPVTAATFSSTKRAVVSVGEDLAINIWDLETGNLIEAAKGIAAKIDSFDISSDEDHWAIVTQGSLLVNNIRQGKLQQQITELNNPVLCTAFHPQRPLLAFGRRGGEIELIDLKERKRRLAAKTENPVVGLSFHPQENLIAAIDDQGNVTSWDTTTGNAGQQLPYNRMKSIAWHPQGGLVATVGGGKVQLVSEKSKDGTIGLDPHRGEAVDARFNHDGKLLLTAGNDNAIRVSHTKSQQRKHVLTGHDSRVWSVAISRDGKLLASVGKDRSVRIWVLATGKLLHTLSGHTASVIDVAFSPDGAWLASASDDHTVRVWDVKTGREMQKLPTHENPVFAVAVRPDGKTIATAGMEGVIRRWNTGDWRELPPLRGHRGQIWSLKYSADGMSLISASHDGTAIVWDTANEKMQTTFNLHTRPLWSTAISPTEQLAASTDHVGKVFLWEADNGSPRHELKGHRGAVLSVAFRGDGKQLATGGSDGSVRLWNVDNGRLEQTIQIGPPGGLIDRVVYTTDGRHLVTANGNGTLYVLRLASKPTP